MEKSECSPPILKYLGRSSNYGVEDVVGVSKYLISPAAQFPDKKDKY